MHTTSRYMYQKCGKGNNVPMNSAKHKERERERDSNISNHLIKQMAEGDIVLKMIGLAFFSKKSQILV